MSGVVSKRSTKSFLRITGLMTAAGTTLMPLSARGLTLLPLSTFSSSRAFLKSASVYGAASSSFSNSRSIQ